MTIPDYTALMIDAGEYSGRSDIAHMFPRFVGLAEAKMNRVLRVSDMEKVGSLALISGDGELPDDFLEPREVVSADGRTLGSWSLQSLTNRYGNNGGSPQGYAIVGRTLMARPGTTGNIAVTYYAKIPPLTPANPTNWLLERAPDVYLYSLVEEISIWAKDVEAVMNSRTLKENAMQGLALADEGMRWGNSQVTLSGCTP
ncbi:phage adaptor protein [Agrobacterium rubi]|uniref:Uncharacterized protein n=1 Tax=Agrobacterium rubi TaxID=28099 RepID=A0ABX2J2M5_9HYPH|nr:hypothetical protein [Agrobacterium rubi]NTF35562.1 hypothetical protein [Agrobacterium rubi]